MGTWSSSLYGNDTTCDVRDTYTSFLEEQLSNHEAYEKTLEEMHDLIGDDDEPLLWFVLAETQWKLGRLTPDVKEKALEWIEKDGWLELWQEDGGTGKGWLNTLEKLRQKLESPMPKEKKIKKPEEVDLNPWNINDVYAYQFNKKYSEEKGIFGKYMVLQKIGEKERDVWPHGITTVMRIQVFDKVFETLPTLADLEGLRILPLDLPERFNISQDAKDYYGRLKKKDPICMSALITWAKKSEYPKKYLIFLGNMQGPLNLKHKQRELSIANINGWFTYYEKWQGIEYDEISEGEYDYKGNIG